ncbi:hypothetical protein [Paludisphaera rhizosphaerae]|uniref:hypothetical protein n=1 Tax=Paludisphaera rhizosphaerae TaxID=2711216 RepID=UPI0013EBD585|nr:hypothetical protein [Paludisphaera rhizosphaerae]
MNPRLFGIVPLALMALTPTIVLAAAKPDLSLRSFKGNRATVEPLAGTPRGVRITFQTAEWPNARIDAGDAPFSWTGAGRLVLDLKNPGAEEVEFGVRIDDDPKADGIHHCRTAQGRLRGGEAGVFAIELGKEGPMSLGMRGLPGRKGEQVLALHGDESLNLGHVVAVQVFLHAPKTPRTLEIRSAEFAPAASITGIVDAFGQYTEADWPGKVHSESELKTLHKADLADVAAHPAPADRNQYGGWRSGPKEKATGFFHAAKRDGRWWLVDPEGSLFFSMGADCVRMNDVATIVTGRENLFTWLPKTGEPLARGFGRVTNVHSGPVKKGETFSFYQANLVRLYGTETFEPWADASLKRLSSWGFNTIGNWSDVRLARKQRMPYVATLGVYGDMATISSGDDYWGKMKDPFDPKFAEAVRRSVAEGTTSTKGDPWCLGYFVDNELSWGGAGDRGRVGLALGTLDGSAVSSPAKRALVDRLKKQYGEVARLNSAWKTDFKDWFALDASWKPQGEPSSWTKAFHDDLRGFVKEFARAYFKTIRDELKKADPNHLYMGCRFAWKTPEAIEAAGEICDVVSFNIYKKSVDPAEWSFLEKIDKPAIIGEFHFGALDRGMFHTGLVPTGSQEERAAAYATYVQSVLDHPSFVGCHWFQFIDEPITGRSYDGENYNIGFLNVADLAYPELVAAARAVHSQAYQRRSTAKRP